jgi:DNA-binding XRE family transcriptional regulator
VGFTQEGLAEALGIDRTTVVRWEAAETEPQPWMRPKLARLLRVTLDELDELLIAITEVTQDDGRLVVSSVPLDFSLASRQTVRIIEGFSAHDISSRRQLLAGLSVLAGAALLRPVRQWTASLPAANALRAEKGSDEVVELEQAVRLFRQWDAPGVGGVRSKAVVGQLNAVAETLRDDQAPAPTRRLFQITAELAQLAGWMAYDQDLSGIAQR